MSCADWMDAHRNVSIGMLAMTSLVDACHSDVRLGHTTSHDTKASVHRNQKHVTCAHSNSLCVPFCRCAVAFG